MTFIKHLEYFFVLFIIDKSITAYGSSLYYVTDFKESVDNCLNVKKARQEKEITIFLNGLV